MKENGFAIGLLAGTLVLGGGLVALGLSQGKTYNERQAEFSSIKSEVEQMARVRPFPTEENLEARQTEVTALRGKVEGLQNALQAYRPEEMERISPSEFQNRLVAKTEEIKALFDEKGISYPEQFALGMESYLDALANPEATAKLNYQLNATEWFFRQLAEEGGYAVRNVVRQPLPSESGQSWTEPFERDRLPVPLAQSLPMEFTILADEDVAVKLLNSLSTSKDYFFAIDMVRIGNENVAPPVRSQAGLEEVAEDDGGGDEGAGGFGGFEGFDFGDGGDDEAAAEEEAGEEEAAVEVADSGRILGQVLGNEGVYAAYQVRLLLFGEPVELPEIAE
ncbi:Amuc_1100 family pilus-like protein [Roseibacillus ishigakijimensis]|uniref:Uncharacterized protein n=1 Tax=Roseibacillus ishigakijimensis TaxID=454146 RepID=A0A934VNA6_9BACT|nr:Amuc_1100 family pilus-like protein [Roseibacillus ishigakijimensis]MBK1834830.1 hypothetical protein [Roseibacillus ishigakijimensis]